MKFFITTFFTLISLLPVQKGIAQATESKVPTEPPQNWFLLDPIQDEVQGIGIEKAYAELLAGKPFKKIIVAVLDTGVDIDHEDLKNNIWINEDEVADNGIDDDKNGYVDDTNGWNFIGGKEGNLINDHAEVTREYIRLKPIYENAVKPLKKNKTDFEYWGKVKAKYERDSQANKKKLEEFEQQLNLYAGAFYTTTICDSIIKKELAIKSVTRAEVESLNATSDTLLMAKETLQSIFESIDQGVDLNQFLTELGKHVYALQEYVESLKAGVLGYDLAYTPRIVVGDDSTNPTEKFYGNNDVNDPSKHGTHVAGIIAADRNNSIGTKGVADHVTIMPVRVVPASGDERDKDVANGIMYAVDNGATVINMSFGKYFSPYKDVVEKAIRYAEQKGVLLLHAAGNDSDDIDTKDHFPVPTYANGKKASNWLEIGASSWSKGENLAADFSNYGKKTVDVFAPGVSIYSTTPANEYESLQGTSMASPVVAGVAAVLMAYFPELIPTDVAAIIQQSSSRFDALKVTKPGSTEQIGFKQLSKTGGIVNAFEAVKLASKWKK
jgi:cell wall-associated protease